MPGLVCRSSRASPSSRRQKAKQQPTARDESRSAPTTNRTDTHGGGSFGETRCWPREGTKPARRLTPTRDGAATEVATPRDSPCGGSSVAVSPDQRTTESWHEIRAPCVDLSFFRRRRPWRTAVDRRPVISCETATFLSSQEAPVRDPHSSMMDLNYPKDLCALTAGSLWLVWLTRRE